MPSSTSSSSDRAPRDPRGLCVLTAFAIFLTGLMGLEAFWRMRGRDVEIEDSRVLWAQERVRASNGNPDTVALLGASRIQLGFSTATFQESFPDGTLVHLAVDGAHPIATLRDLANDEAFVGTVICAVTARSFDSTRWEDQQAHVDFYHGGFDSIDASFNHAVSGAIEHRLVLRNHSLRLQQLLVALVRGQGFAPPPYLVTHPDRSRSADYTLVDVVAQREGRMKRARAAVKRSSHLTPQEWLSGLRVVEQAVQQIQQRGGRVVFVRFPTTGALWDFEEKTTPRSLFWDRLAQSTSAAVLHFQDVPEMTEFTCPDLSHLDQRDKSRFTKTLLEELVGIGVFPADCCDHRIAARWSASHK